MAKTFDRLGRLLGVGALVALTSVTVGASASSGTPAAAAVQVPSFNGTASADGIRITYDDPGGPLADKLVDVGGPTAQSSLSTLGSSTAYAALPDPGQVVNSAPGLVVGLVSQGAYGLPPVKLPKLPPLPLQVSTDVNGKTKASFGAGPYKLSAASSSSASTADADGGLTTGSTAVAGLTAHASVTVNSDGSVTAAATSTVSGLVIGPVTLASIVSTASETIAPNGKVTGTSSTKIVAARIGGISVGISAGQLTIGGVGIAVPLDNLLAPLEKKSGTTLMFQNVQTSPGTVIAPNIVINTQTKGTVAPGYFRLTIGGASASMVGAAAPPVTNPTTGITQPTSPGSGGGVVVTPPATAPVVIGPVTSPSTQPVSTPQPTVTPPARAVQEVALTGLFGVRSMYLIVASLALAVFLLSQLVRLLGVRR